ncbi:putative flagellar protein FlgJ [Dinoroseobacter shibae DFL 12 = DSM 16493]|jgi:Rod binding domain-containing protein|uniref:Putative flagellar protein FlgJ n=1 Tax=Dinoroseobacter shibae (strain DSM 16493 / NCIMB 14021 / DFL 12) TaxID=398580 RepID=A8LNK2_DINSH|nr:rod-binding protein [Dinoroseobacter shibae]ABV95096.1 putative flagellar protein FlgJ [Dinoroseobacter shibae DFL 12 = DSM 16493]URF46511.1 rod-binding protein [Dinoroseobacter shibae]URF50817.1 rod-binding protein [Dinoroseobacter shibae]
MERIAHFSPALSTARAQDAQSGSSALEQAAKDLEAAFLSVMLKEARFGVTPETMGGGVGEDQFASFLRDEHAKALVENGGIGLAEALFNALKGDVDVEST